MIDKVVQKHLNNKIMKTLTDQQKLEILCAYLPHGVEVESDKIYSGFTTKLVVSNLTNSLANGLTIASALDYDAKLILRHPDDMTEEESDKYRELWESDSNYLVTGIESLQYLWSIHVDTFDAIEAGFAVRKNINETTQLRVRFQPNDCDEVFTGTVIESRKHSYLVVPDDNLTGTAHWSKLYCEIIKGN